MISLSLFLFSLTSALLEIGGLSLSVEIAETEEERVKGLGGRDFLPENSGMLFVYEKPRILSFWMKDTSIPLSIAFFDKDRRLTHIEHMNPSLELPLFQSKSPCAYALEVPQGWFEKHQIGPGAQFTIKE